MVEAQLGPGVALARDLARIKAQLMAQASSPILQNASATQSDGSPGVVFYQNPTYGNTQTIWYYGPGEPGASQTNGLWPPLLAIGQLVSGGSVVGTGVVTQRPNGSTSMTIGNDGVGLIDHNQQVIWSESETAFGGIKTPFLPSGTFVNTNTSTWPATTAGSWTTISTLYMQVMQPNFYWWADGYAPTGVTGQFRMLCAGSQIGTTWTASNNAFGSGSQGAALPAGVSYGQAVAFQLQAQVTAGTGSVAAMVYGTQGYATS